MSRLQSIRATAEQFISSPTGSRILKALRLLIGAAVVFILFRYLSRIGWSNLLSEMPRTPWFYVIVVVMYFLLPVYETGIYRRFFPAKKRSLFSAFIRKKVLNLGLMGYSGEVFLLLWVKEKLGISRAKVLRIMVDVGITSSMGAFTATGLLLGLLLSTGSIKIEQLVGENDQVLFFGMIIVIAAVASAGYRFRHTLFKLDSRTIMWLYGAHLSRFLFIYILQILQWWVVLPDVPFQIWGTMLAIQTVTNRLPFLVTPDLIAMGVILGIPGLLEGGEAAIAAMLVTRSVLDRVISVSMFVPLSIAGGRSLAHSRNGSNDSSGTGDEGETDA